MNSIMIFIGLFVALLFTFPSISRIIYRQHVATINFFAMALGWTTLFVSYGYFREEV